MDEDEDEWQEHVEYETSTITVGRGTRSFPLNITQVAELPATANLFMLLEQSQRAAAGELNDTEISGKKVWAGSLLLCQYLCERAADAELAELADRHGRSVAASQDDGAERTDACEANGRDCTASRAEASTCAVSGRRVLELGAGSGLVSMTAALLGSASAVATDGDREVVGLVQQNIAANAHHVAISRGVRARTLWWGDQASLAALRAEENVSPSRDAFEVLLAGDVLYKQPLLPLFFGTVSNLLQPCPSAPSPVLYLCHIPRAGVGVEAVEDAARAHGLCVRRIAVRVVAGRNTISGDGGHGGGKLGDGCAAAEGFEAGTGGTGMVLQLPATIDSDAAADAARATLLQIRANPSSLRRE